jgi:hypothetical protein
MPAIHAAANPIQRRCQPPQGRQYMLQQFVHIELFVGLRGATRA